jgi:hypothetical protein
VERVFAMSKRTFKQAIGKMFQQELITIVNPERRNGTGYIEISKAEQKVPDRVEFTPAQIEGMRIHIQFHAVY